MSVTVRRYKGSGWEADIRFRLPSGKRHRERSKAPVNSKSAAQRWGEERERHLEVRMVVLPTRLEQQHVGARILAQARGDDAAAAARADHDVIECLSHCADANGRYDN